MLKVLYASLKNRENPYNYDNLQEDLNIISKEGKTAGLIFWKYFKGVSWTNLIRHNKIIGEALITFHYGNYKNIYKIHSGTQRIMPDYVSDFVDSLKYGNDNGVYIPPQEMLSLFKNFVNIYSKNETEFDEFYYDLKNLKK